METCQEASKRSSRSVVEPAGQPQQLDTIQTTNEKRCFAYALDTSPMELRKMEVLLLLPCVDSVLTRAFTRTDCDKSPVAIGNRGPFGSNLGSSKYPIALDSITEEAKMALINVHPETQWMHK
jgi:hypothetical protein